MKELYELERIVEMALLKQRLHGESTATIIAKAILEAGYRRA